MLDLGEVGVGDASHCRDLTHRQLSQLSLPADDVADQISDDSDPGFMASILKNTGVMHVALAPLAKLAVFANMESVVSTNEGETIMATTTTSKKVNDFTEGFGDAAERYRSINEKLVETSKKTANAAIDGYEKTIASYVDFRQQLAEATQLDWVTTVVKAQNDF